ncbi:MAG: hypothetical protein JSV24_04900, partial [Bacteroidales bacterium]
AILFALIVIIGGAFGFIRFKTTKRFYSSDMIAQINATNAGEMMSHINDLHNLCREGNYNVLSEYLKLDSNIAVKIKDINAFWIIDQNKDGIGDYVDYQNDFDLNDTSHTRISNRFNLQVEVYDNTGFMDVTEGLYNYVAANPYLTNLNENRKRRIKELIVQVDEELLKLDSLQQYEYFKNEPEREKTDGQMLIWNEKELKLLHPDLIQLFRLKQQYEKELEIFPDVITVIKDFTPLAQVENPKSSYIIRWAIVFVIIGIVAKFIFDQRKNINKIINPT